VDVLKKAGWVDDPDARLMAGSVGLKQGDTRLTATLAQNYPGVYLAVYGPKKAKPTTIPYYD